MSDMSVNFSNESRASSPGPTLVPPPTLSISPHSAQAIVDGNPDLDAITLRGIAEGLVATIKSRDAQYRQERNHLAARIEGLEKNLEHYTNTFETAPPGYIENGSRFPEFTIPIPGSHGLSSPAKWIKLLDDGRVAGYSDTSGRSDLPAIADIYLVPVYDGHTPFEPLPSWFRRLLLGNDAQYNLLKEATQGLEQWAHMAEVKRYRGLQDDIEQAQAQINSLRADIEGWSQSKELCEGRLAAGRTHEWVAHLQGHESRQLGMRGGPRRARFGRGRPN